ncbi:efflux transporter outer membrane subunit [Aquincola sp. MAHUQ-54]|uniref:Efflux transporter outer membrane subunit n=1 Tax=Aquincola agrisoli TaxID=3119538 RepID=A0AAW9QAW9_9BURK
MAGCASPAGIQSTAQPIDPARVGLSSGAALPEVQPDWWQAFGDAQLNGLVERALADHPSLQVAAARVARAGAAIEDARAAERPSATLSAGATRQRYTENGMVPAPLAGSTRTDATLQAGLSWEIDFFGRHRAALASALGGERAAAAEADAARLMLATHVVRSYVGLARAVALRDVAQRALAQRDEVLGLVRQRVDAGLDTTVELRQGEGALPEARVQIEQLDEQIALARHELAALTAQAPGALAGLAPALGPVQAAPLPAQLGADLLGRRPDIAAARWRVEAATQDVAVARTEFYPNVNLTAFAGFSALGLDHLLQSGSRQYGAGPAIRLPIFDAGRLRANLRGRSADLDAAVQSYNGAVLDAVRDVADQVASLQSIDRQQHEQQAAQAAAESAYDLALQRYRAGLGTYLVVLNAESNVLAQRRAAADLKARALDSQALLMRSLGGGWRDAPSTVAAAAH